MKNKELSSRIFEVMQYIKHPISGEELISLDIIKKALKHKTIKKWAYVLHDKDVYLEKDEKENPEHKAGMPKPAHYHIVIWTGSNNMDIEVIAKWFGVATNFVEIKKGRGAFLDCVEYLTHEAEKQQDLGKYRYNDKEVVANFDFRAELDARMATRLKYGGDLSIKEQFRYDVLVSGKTLVECQLENPLAYSDDMATLKKLRLEYLYNQTPPTTRINYYISGRGGVGKGLASRALARSLFPDLKNDDEIFFIIGAENATFEGYDGQPVIIWDDMRAFDLLKLLGGRGNVFNVLDTHPVKKRQNVKFGSINLINKVNIINSVQSYSEFLDGLAGEYTARNGEKMSSEDKNQSYRRIPFIINLHEEDFDLLVNKGFIENSSNFEEFEQYKNICGNFQKVRVALRNNEELAQQIENQMLTLPTQKYNEVLEAQQQQDTADVDLIMSQFANYGKVGKVENSSDIISLGVNDKQTFTQDEVKKILNEYKNIINHK